MKIKCEICDKEIGSASCLSKHIKREHKITPEEYYITTHKIDRPKCLVCGNQTKLRSITKGFNTLCSLECQYKYINPTMKWYYISRGFTEEQAIKEISKYQSNLSKKAHKNFKLSSMNTRVEYYTERGYTEEEAKMMISKRQNLSSLKSFQNRYGEKLGLEKYNERIKKFKQTYENKDEKTKEKENKSRGRTKEQLIEIYGEEKALEILKNRLPKTKSVSKLETRVFNELKKDYPTIKKQKIIKKNENYYIFDIVINNIIFEINGTYWHADSRKYKEDDIIYRGLTAKEIWQKDRIKKDAAELNGYVIFYIWEEEINSDFNKTIQNIKFKIKQFFNN